MVKQYKCMDCDLLLLCRCGDFERSYLTASHTHWGGGDRCTACSERFGALLAEKKAKIAQIAHQNYLAHLDADHDDGEVCEECCEHGDIDKWCCLICGADLGEAMMADAYGRAKDIRKYGE